MEERKAYLRMLRSPARRAILVYLAEHGPSRFMDIKKATGLSTGTIYHHIRSLEGYVTQDDSRLYRLTESGKILVSSIFSTTRQPALIEDDLNVASVNDLLLEFYPTLAKTVSFMSLIPIYKKLSSVGLQLAVFVACLEFMLLIGSHVSPLSSPVIGVYGFSVGGVLETFALSFFVLRFLRWLLAGRNQALKEAPKSNRISRLAQSLVEFVEPELLSTFSLGFSLIYLSFLAQNAPMVGQAVSLILFFWGYVAVAAATSYTSGLELMPSLLLPFAMIMFTSAVGQAMLEGYFGMPNIGFDLIMGALAVLVAAWADRSMKSLFTKRLPQINGGAAGPVHAGE